MTVMTHAWALSKKRSISLPNLHARCSIVIVAIMLFADKSDWAQDPHVPPNGSLTSAFVTGALKRQRQDLEAQEAEPHPDQAPQVTKKSRRSYVGATVTNSSYPVQQSSAPAVGSQPTFAVEMSGNPMSRQQTPNYTPNQTPKTRPAKLPSPERQQIQQHYHHPPPPQPLYHHPQAGHPPMNGSPIVEQPPRAPVWNPVNHGPSGQNNAMSPQGPRNYDPRREKMDVRPPPQTQPQHHHEAPNTRVLRSKSITQQQPAQNIAPAPPAPLQMRPAYPPAHPAPPAALPAAPPMAPRPYHSHNDAARHLQARFTGAIDQHLRSLDEIKACQAELQGMLQDRGEIDGRWQEEHQRLLHERDRLRSDIVALRQWGQDLQQGNLELQQYENRYRETRNLYEQMEEENRRLRHEAEAAALLRTQLSQRETQLANARKVLRENGFDEHGEKIAGIGDGERRNRKELHDWVMQNFRVAANQESKLRSLVDSVEGAGWKELPGELQMLKAYVSDVARERENKEEEWKRYIGPIYGSQSPIPAPTGGDDTGADADDEGEGDDDANANGARKGRFLFLPHVA
jgi:hypothetical protein